MINRIITYDGECQQVGLQGRATCHSEEKVHDRRPESALAPMISPNVSGAIYLPSISSVLWNNCEVYDSSRRDSSANSTFGTISRRCIAWAATGRQNDRWPLSLTSEAENSSPLHHLDLERPTQIAQSLPTRSFTFPIMKIGWLSWTRSTAFLESFKLCAA